MTRSIYVISPNGQQQCAGEYKQSQDSANGCPVWEQKGGGFWMYTGANGMWIIGGQDAKDKNFKCSHGFIFCRTQNAGVSPEKITGVWERLSGEYFVEDRNIVVTNVLHKPSPLRVASPNGQQRCAGEYALMPDCTANGLPVWEHKAGRCYLYCGTNGSWILGGSDAKEKGFKCAKGVVYSKRASGGLMPDKVGGGWLRLHGDKFHEDSAITVTVKPSRLYVQTPHGQHRCSGEYVPAEDRLANGYPLWEHAGGKCWLYSGSNGMWIIGGTDAAAKNFECTRGVIYCQTVHNGQMPDKMVGNWLRLDGDKFREDAAILVGTKPSSLHVLCPNGQPKCGGEYVLVGDRWHGQPTWKQRRTDLRICSGADGHWMVAAARKENGDSEKPLLRCDQPHLGETPDKVVQESCQLNCIIVMVPPCRLIVRATAGARVIGKQGASIKAIRAATGINSVRVLQDELPEALKRREEAIVIISCGEEAMLRQAAAMVLDKVFDRSGLPDSADRERERPHVLDMIVPERAGGGIVGQGGERIRAIIEELGCEVQVSREPLAGIASQKRVKLLARDRVPIEAALWRLQSTLKELVVSEVLRSEHFELREALMSEAEAAMSAEKERFASKGKTEVPLRILLAQGEAATVVGKLGANVARLRDLALVSIDDAESPPFHPSERICSAARATLAQRLRVLRLVLGDLATRSAAIAREEEAARPQELEPVLQMERSLFPDGLELEVQASQVFRTMGSEDMEKAAGTPPRMLDDQIKVSSTSSLGKPVKLHVSTPSGQQSCGGEYLLVAGESANGSPLWKQMGGKYWLYSGTNGLWIIGGSGAKRKNFDCSRGVIYSQTPHGGQLPHQVSGIWLRLQGQEFVEDSKISIVQ
ncbi:PCBP1 [Symbiodinium sp. KB8]|nr:PCBP1 [Symbiodinium sp. KB8]